MKKTPSKSTRSLRTSPYPRRVAGQAGMAADGIASGSMGNNAGQQGQQQEGPTDKANQEEMPQPVAPQVQEGQRSVSRPSPCCARREEIVALHNSVDQLNQAVERQLREINRMRTGMRHAGVALRQVVQDELGDERQDRRANDEVDTGYDSDVNTGED